MIDGDLYVTQTWQKMAGAAIEGGGLAHYLIE
jgi:hypothetical protein